MALTYSQRMPLGTKAFDFSLPAADGKTYSLADFAGKKALVIIFSCNHCPYAQASWDPLTKLAKAYQDKEVAFVAINPNDETSYPEDSFEKMPEYVKKFRISFPYLRDKSQAVAKNYQAVCTPDVYLFDEKQKLFYHGRINDNWSEPQKVTKERS